MKLTIVAAGKLKSPGAKQWVEHFIQRVSYWSPRFQLEQIEIKTGEKDSEEVLRTIHRNSQVGSNVGRSFVILLDETGKSLSTPEWVTMFDRCERAGIKNIQFGIGGSYGFDKTSLSQADLVLSLGRGTLSHELARMVLAEQLYRTCSVPMGHPYHHGQPHVMTK